MQDATTTQNSLVREMLFQLGAFAAGEAASRATRILATIAIARALSPENLGIAAMAVAVSEIIKTAASGGIGPQIVSVTESKLASIIKPSKQIMWILCLSLVLIQSLVGLLLAEVMGNQELFTYIAALSAVLLFMAPGLVPCFLIMREKQLTQTAKIGAIQMVADNFLTIALVTIWPSVWAVVLPKIISAPLWLWLTLKYAPAEPGSAPVTAPADALALVKNGLHVMASDLATAAKTQADKILLGLLLGSHALGIYVFAFNIGLGIALSVTAAFSMISYSHLCNSRDMVRVLKTCLVFGLAVITPFVLLQMAASPIYVPLLFGEIWSEAIPVLIILSIAAIPRMAATTIGRALRASSQTSADARWSMGSTILVLGATVLAGLSGSPVTVAWAFLIAIVITDGAMTFTYLMAQKHLIRTGEAQ